MAAKSERDGYAIYGLDLLWVIAKSKYPDADFPQPSKMKAKKDTRTAEQIKKDILRKLG